MSTRPVVHAVRCTYPQCQATNGCVGACSKGQAEKQEPYGYFRYDIQLDAWVQNRESTQGVAFYTEPPKLEWENVTDDALIEEVRRRGFTIRDTQISAKRWIGLTDEEYKSLHNKNYNYEELARAVEVKLKERNT